MPLDPIWPTQRYPVQEFGSLGSTERNHVAEQNHNNDITPLDKEWWKQFADSFMEDGEVLKDGASDASDELSRRFDDALEKGRAKVEEMISSSRATADKKVHSALSDISDRLDRIEDHLKKNTNAS